MTRKLIKTTADLNRGLKNHSIIVHVQVKQSLTSLENQNDKRGVILSQCTDRFIVAFVCWILFSSVKDL
jgi:hypothetical protein